MNTFAKNLLINKAFRKPSQINFMGKQFYRPRQYRKPGIDLIKQTKEYKEQSRIHHYYNYGLYAAVFGMCFGMVPLYRIFCEHLGIIGDYEQKDYSKKANEVQNTHRKFRIRFKAEPDPDVNWEFDPVQDELFVNAGETALMFYRAYNGEPDPVIGFSTYNVYPEEAQQYFSKIQCFCFNQQLLNPKEELQLPLYFYIEPEILDDNILVDTNEIRIIYQFIKCAKQDMLKHVEEELERVKKNKQFLSELRQKKLALDPLLPKSKESLELMQLKELEAKSQQEIQDLMEKVQNIKNMEDPQKQIQEQIKLNQQDQKKK